MRLVLGGMVGALAFTLAGCGSSGSPTPSPTPTPTPTGTPTPTPTPTDVTFTTSEAGLQYTLENGIQLVANTAAVAPAMGTAFRYTPTQGGYTYVLQNGSVVPSASESVLFPVASIKDCGAPRTTLCFGTGFVHQQVDAAASSYFLSRFIPGSTNAGLQLSFSAFGALEESAAAGGRRLVDLRPFAYGVATPATGTDAIPTTGTHTFNGLVIGQATGNKPAGLTTPSNLYQLTGTLQVVANYAAATATIKLTLNATPTGCSPCEAAVPLTYDGTGTLAAGVASFTLPGGGTARFFLAGPGAAEIAGSFVLTAADPREAAVTMTLAGSGAGRR